MRGARAALLGLALLLAAGCSTDRHLIHAGPLRIDGVDTPRLVVPLTSRGEIRGEATVTEILGFIKLGPDEWAEGIEYSFLEPPPEDSSSGARPLVLLLVFRLQGLALEVLLQALVPPGGGVDGLAKSAAAWEAVKAGSCDVILAPKYSIHVDDYFLWRVTRATVEGTGATKGAVQTVR